MDPPGRRLRQAREALGLSQADIASHLRLSVPVVDALERDDFEHLPPATFVRGYLRNYAAEVSLPGDELIDAYNQNAGKAGPVLHVGPKRAEFRESSPDNQHTVLFIGLVAVLLLLAAALYWRSHQHGDAAQPPHEQLQQGRADAPAAPVEQRALPELQPPAQELPPGIDATVPEAAPAADAAAAEEMEAGAPAMEESLAVEEGSGGAEMAAAEELPSAPALVAGVEVFTIEGALSDTPGLLLSDASATQLQELQAAGLMELVLYFRQQSWVEVRDGDGVRHLYQLGKRGKAYRVYGKSPFRVKLGDASVVEVYGNGVPFDTSSFPAGKIVRFSVKQ